MIAGFPLAVVQPFLAKEALPSPSKGFKPPLFPPSTSVSSPFIDDETFFPLFHEMFPLFFFPFFTRRSPPLPSPSRAGRRIRNFSSPSPAIGPLAGVTPPPFFLKKDAPPSSFPPLIGASRIFPSAEKRCPFSSGETSSPPPFSAAAIHLRIKRGPLLSPLRGISFPPPMSCQSPWRYLKSEREDLSFFLFSRHQRTFLSLTFFSLSFLRAEKIPPLPFLFPGTREAHSFFLSPCPHSDLTFSLLMEYIPF